MKRFITATTLSFAVCALGCSQQAKEEVGKAVDGAGAGVSDSAKNVGESATDAAESAKTSAGTTVTAAKVAAGDAAESAGETAGAAKDGLAKGMTAVTEKASAALANVQGGPEALKNVTALFDSAKETLSGIKDTEPAQAAVAKLGDLDGSISKLSEAINGLPKEARTALAPVIEKGVASLNTLAEKASSIPGVQAIIQPKIEQLTEKLSTLTSQESPE